MKGFCATLAVLMLVLSGCKSEDKCMCRILDFRQTLMKAEGCSFLARIEADNGENVYVFSMQCRTDKDGNLSFEVVAPATIAGISGSFHLSGGQLTFHDAVLAFPALADGEVTPISAPWILIKTLLSGYIGAVGMENDYLRATIHENYEHNALQLDVWFDSTDKPIQGEILWQGRRVLTVKVENFQIL